MSQNSQQKFATLEPQTRYISEKRIKKQWKKAPEGVNSRVVEILRDVQRTGLVQRKHGRPGRNNTRTAREEEEIVERQREIDETITLINKRISRLPFPPGTQESDFDYEAILDTNRALESQLTGNNHSVALLQLEIAKEKAALAEDQKELKSLEDALRSTEVVRRRQAKNLNPLAKAMLAETMESNTSSNRGINNLATSEAVIDLHAVKDDPEIGPLLIQLRNHLESMDNNTTLVRGISDVILQSQATLDVYSAKTFTNEQLGQLYEVGSA